jgi:hypothetical protein
MDPRKPSDAETRKWVRNNGVGSAKVGAILQQH